MITLEKYTRAGLEEMINPPPQVQKRSSQDDLDKKKKKLKTLLEKSLSDERTLLVDVAPNYDTTQNCIETIRNCERLIKIGSLSVLRHSIMQGEAISHLKKKVKKEQRMSTLLAENNVKITSKFQHHTVAF